MTFDVDVMHKVFFLDFFFFVILVTCYITFLCL